MAIFSFSELQVTDLLVASAGVNLTQRLRESFTITSAAVWSSSIAVIFTSLLHDVSITVKRIFTQINADLMKLSFIKDLSEYQSYNTFKDIPTIKVVALDDTTKTASCDITVIPAKDQEVTVTGVISKNTTWFSYARYFLSGFVYVKNNATLTIQPGTIIKGVSGTKATLIIERGSKIDAQGTSSEPIIFTSDKPAGQRAAGDWGGVVICGKATTNKHDQGTGIGIAEGGIGSMYGGTDDSDN